LLQLLFDLNRMIKGISLLPGIAFEHNPVHFLKNQYGFWSSIVAHVVSTSTFTSGFKRKFRERSYVFTLHK
jgi:hypothetical protein